MTEFLRLRVEICLLIAILIVFSLNTSAQQNSNVSVSSGVTIGFQDAANIPNSTGVTIAFQNDGEASRGATIAFGTPANASYYYGHSPNSGNFADPVNTATGNFTQN